MVVQAGKLAEDEILKGHKVYNACTLEKYFGEYG